MRQARVLVASVQRDHRRRHLGDRRLRPLRRLPHARGRIFPAASEVVMVYGGAGRRRVREPGRRPHREDDRGGHPGVPGDRARGHDRLHDRLDRRLGDRALRRPSLPERHGRWPHLDEEKSTEPSAGSSAGRTGRSSRPPDARRPLVRLDPGGGDVEAPFVRYTPLTLAAPRSGASRSRAPGTPPGRAGRTSTTRSATSTTSSAPRSSASPRGSSSDASGGGAASPRRRSAADERDGRPVPRPEGRSRELDSPP